MLHRGQQRLLLPVNPWFIAGSLLVSLLLNLLPGGHALPWIPDFLLLGLCFWTLHQPRRIGIGVAFLFGLVMDVHQGMLLGIHALAYAVAAFAMLLAYRRLQWFRPSTQALQMLGVFLVTHGVIWVLRMASGGHFPGWQLLLAPLLEAALWPLVSMVLLAPQRRAVDHDVTRPL